MPCDAGLGYISLAIHAYMWSLDVKVPCIFQQREICSTCEGTLVSEGRMTCSSVLIAHGLMAFISRDWIITSEKLGPDEIGYRFYTATIHV